MILTTYIVIELEFAILLLLAILFATAGALLWRHAGRKEKKHEAAVVPQED